MDRCESYQLNLSAMLDGELFGDDLAQTVLHLAACPNCLQEFQRFQALQGRVHQEINLPSVPHYLWSSILEQQRSPAKAKTVSLRPHTFKIIASAAVFLLCFGLGFVLGAIKLPVSDPKTPIVLASNRGDLTDERFLQLTRELLTADPLYQQKMYLILHTLLDQGSEGGLDNLKESDPSGLITPTVTGNESLNPTYKF